jgi:hypothetical protein
VWGIVWGVNIDPINNSDKMPSLKRVKTKYPGVYYIDGTSASGKIERIYYIRYRRDKKLIEEKAGRQLQDDMTPARAAGIRTERIEGKQPSNRRKRESKIAAEKEKISRWTIEKIYKEYIDGRPDNKARKTDEGRYEKYLKTSFGEKEPKATGIQRTPSLKDSYCSGECRVRLSAS